MQARALALFYSAVNSTTNNIPERHIFLTPVADQFRSRSTDRFSTTIKELC